MPSSTSPKSDPYIIYGRGGAGNIHHRSTIRSAWKSIKNSPSSSPPVTLSVSPDNYYAAWNAKSEDPRKARRESALASSASADCGELKRNTSSGSLSFLKSGSDSVKRNTSSGSLFSLSRSEMSSRSHSGLSGLSKIFGRRASVEDDRSVSTSTTVESVQEEEDDGEAMVMRSTKGKGKERAQE